MEHNEAKNNRDIDFIFNWVNSSRFLFYLQIFVVVAFLFGGCYNLYQHRYKGKPAVEVPESTHYNPQYK